MLRSRRFLLGLAISVFFIGFFLYRADLGDMARAVRTANYLYVIPGVLLYFVGLWWRTVRWRVILNPLGSFPVSRLWPVMMVGYAANNVLPVRLGELVRSYYLSTREGTSSASSLATILVERLFDGLALLFLVAVVSLFIPVVGLFQDLGAQANVNWLVLTLGLSVPFFGTTLGIVVLAVWPKTVERALVRLLGLLPERISPAAVRLSLRFLEGLSALRSPRRALAIFVLSLPVWLSEAAMYAVISLGFGVQDAFSGMGMLVGVIVLTTATSNLGTSIPSTGGGIGPFEFFSQATLIFFGVGTAVASAYAVVLHVALLTPVTIVGLVHLWTSDISLGQLARQSQARSEPAEASPVGEAQEPRAP